MMNFKDYEDRIIGYVAVVSERDPHWMWTVRSVTVDKVEINWGYLDYLEEVNNFTLQMGVINPEVAHYFFTARTPNDKMIEGYMDEGIDTKQSFLRDIRDAINAIASYAHSRY